MKRKMKNFILTGVFCVALISGPSLAFSQCKDVVWPENPESKAKAEESKVLYEDALRAGQVKQAVGPLNWLLVNVPNHHVSIYINGGEIFDKLATAEKNPERKKKYIDSLMIIYDLRMKTCGDEANVMNRKALSYLKFNANDKPAESLQMLDKALELNGNNIMDATLVPYMQVVRLCALKLKNLTDEQVLQRYDKLMSIIDSKIQKAQSEGKPVDKLQKMKEDIDAILIQTVNVNCDFVRKNIAPKFKQSPKDIDLAKKIFSFMLKDKCTDDPLWLQAAEVIHNDPNEPKNCSLAKNLGIIYITKENYEKAEQFLREAQGICTEKQDKAEILLYLGSLEAKKGKKSEARELFRQAASTDGSVAKEAYEKIGDLYVNSYDQCKQEKSKVDDRLVYLIAFDYYQKAGATRKMATAKEGFPSRTEIFEENITTGTAKSVGCWINESTTIRTRD
jgi:tetratricopeptide (TPR) repeat protein